METTGTDATFTMTSFCTDARESAHSAPFTVTFSANTPLKTVISAGPLTGTAPLDVTFNGADSTGSITNYH